MSYMPPQRVYSAINNYMNTYTAVATEANRGMQVTSYKAYNPLSQLPNYDMELTQTRYVQEINYLTSHVQTNENYINQDAWGINAQLNPSSRYLSYYHHQYGGYLSTFRASHPNTFTAGTAAESDWFKAAGAFASYMGALNEVAYISQEEQKFVQQAQAAGETPKAIASLEATFGARTSLYGDVAQSYLALENLYLGSAEKSQAYQDAVLANPLPAAAIAWLQSNYVFGNQYYSTKTNRWFVNLPGGGYAEWIDLNNVWQWYEPSHHRRGRGCFISSTKVTLKDGRLRKISSLKVGDELKDDSVVLDTYVYDHDDVIYVIKAGKINLTVTSEHPFLVNNVWNQAKNVKKNDILQDSHGKHIKVTVTSTKHFKGKVYNIRTSTGTFYANSILVHNKTAGWMGSWLHRHHYFPRSLRAEWPTNLPPKLTEQQRALEPIYREEGGIARYFGATYSFTPAPAAQESPLNSWFGNPSYYANYPTWFQGGEESRSSFVEIGTVVAGLEYSKTGAASSYLMPQFLMASAMDLYRGGYLGQPQTPSWNATTYPARAQYYLNEMGTSKRLQTIEAAAVRYQFYSTLTNMAPFFSVVHAAEGLSYLTPGMMGVEFRLFGWVGLEAIRGLTAGMAAAPYAKQLYHDNPSYFIQESENPNFNVFNQLYGTPTGKQLAENVATNIAWSGMFGLGTGFANKGFLASSGLTVSGLSLLESVMIPAINRSMVSPNLFWGLTPQDVQRNQTAAVIGAAATLGGTYGMYRYWPHPTGSWVTNAWSRPSPTTEDLLTKFLGGRTGTNPYFGITTDVYGKSTISMFNVDYEASASAFMGSLSKSYGRVPLYDIQRSYMDFQDAGGSLTARLNAASPFELTPLQPISRVEGVDAYGLPYGAYVESPWVKTQTDWMYSGAAQRDMFGGVSREFSMGETSGGALGGIATMQAFNYAYLRTYGAPTNIPSTLAYAGGTLGSLVVGQIGGGGIGKIVGAALSRFIPGSLARVGGSILRTALGPETTVPLGIITAMSFGAYEYGANAPQEYEQYQNYVNAAANAVRPGGVPRNISNPYSPSQQFFAPMFNFLDRYLLGSVSNPPTLAQLKANEQRGKDYLAINKAFAPYYSAESVINARLASVSQSVEAAYDAYGYFRTLERASPVGSPQRFIASTGMMISSEAMHIAEQYKFGQLTQEHVLFNQAYGGLTTTQKGYVNQQMNTPYLNHGQPQWLINIWNQENYAEGLPKLEYSAGWAGKTIVTANTSTTYVRTPRGYVPITSTTTSTSNPTARPAGFFTPPNFQPSISAQQTFERNATNFLTSTYNYGAQVAPQGASDLFIQYNVPYAESLAFQTAYQQPSYSGGNVDYYGNVSGNPWPYNAYANPFTKQVYSNTQHILDLQAVQIGKSFAAYGATSLSTLENNMAARNLNWTQMLSTYANNPAMQQVAMTAAVKNWNLVFGTGFGPANAASINTPWGAIKAPYGYVGSQMSLVQTLANFPWISGNFSNLTTGYLGGIQLNYAPRQYPNPTFYSPTQGWMNSVISPSGSVSFAPSTFTYPVGGTTWGQAGDYTVTGGQVFQPAANLLRANTMYQSLYGTQGPWGPGTGGLPAGEPNNTTVTVGRNVFTMVNGRWKFMGVSAWGIPASAYQYHASAAMLDLATSAITSSSLTSTTIQTAPGGMKYYSATTPMSTPVGTMLQGTFSANYQTGLTQAYGLLVTSPTGATNWVNYGNVSRTSDAWTSIPGYSNLGTRTNASGDTFLVGPGVASGGAYGPPGEYAPPGTTNYSSVGGTYGPGSTIEINGVTYELTAGGWMRVSGRGKGTPGSSTISTSPSPGATLGCFPATAPINTVNGLKKISELKEGDVLEDECNIVTKTITHEPCSRTLLKFTVKGTVLEITDNHVLWNERRRRWMEAKEFKVNDSVKTLGGNVEFIDEISVGVITDEVYDIETSTHIYYVNDVLVHNKIYVAQLGLETTTTEPSTVYTSEYSQPEHVQVTPYPIGSMPRDQRWLQLKKSISSFAEGDHTGGESPSEPVIAVTMGHSVSGGDPQVAINSAAIKKVVSDMINQAVKDGTLLAHPLLWDIPTSDAAATMVWAPLSNKVYTRINTH